MCVLCVRAWNRNIFRYTFSPAFSHRSAHKYVPNAEADIFVEFRLVIGGGYYRAAILGLRLLRGIAGQSGYHFFDIVIASRITMRRFTMTSHLHRIIEYLRTFRAFERFSILVEADRLKNKKEKQKKL